MGLIKLLTGLAFTIVFAIAIITYATNFANDNTTYVSISDDAEISGLNTNLKSDVETFRTTTNSSSSVLTKLMGKVNEQDLEGGSNFLSTPKTLANGIKSIASTSKKTLFGNDNNFGIIFSIFIGLLVMIIALYGWKTLKGGNPD